MTRGRDKRCYKGKGKRMKWNLRGNVAIHNLNHDLVNFISSALKASALIRFFCKNRLSRQSTLPNSNSCSVIQTFC